MTSTIGAAAFFIIFPAAFFIAAVLIHCGATYVVSAYQRPSRKESHDDAPSP